MKKFGVLRIFSFTILFLFLGCSESGTGNDDTEKIEYHFVLPNEVFPVTLYIFDQGDIAKPDMPDGVESNDYLKALTIQKALKGDLSSSSKYTINDTSGSIDVKSPTGNMAWMAIVLSNNTFSINEFEQKLDIANYTEISGIKNSLNLSPHEILYVKDDLFINGNLNVGAGAAINIEKNKKITVYGNTTISGPDILISTPYNQIKDYVYNNIELSGSQVSVNGTIINSGNTALYINNAQSTTTLSDIVFINNLTGLYSNSLNFSGTKIYCISDTVGMEVLESPNVNVSYSWFTNSKTGMTNEDGQFNLTHNLFAKNKMGLLPVNGVHTITNCTFYKNNFGIALNTDSITVSQNDFIENNTGIEFNKNYVHQSVTFSNCTSSNNNFLNNLVHVSAEGENSVSGDAYDGIGMNKDQNFKNNYWIEQDEFSIKQKINDSVTNPSVHNEIIISPFLNSEVSNSGY